MICIHNNLYMYMIRRHGETKAMTMDEIEALSEKDPWGWGNAKYDLWKPYNKYKDLWWDAIDGDPNHGVYHWRPARPDEPEDQGEPSENGGDVDPEPEPEPEPEDPELQFQLVKNGLMDCFDSSYNTNAKIDNPKFGVADGKPIPTSESLFLSGDTNWVANVQGIEQWGVKIKEVSGFRAYAEYKTGRFKVTEKIKSGDKWVVKDTYYKSGDMPTNTSTTTYIKGEYETAKTNSVVVKLEKYKNQVVSPYRYIGNAFLETESEIIITNPAVGGTVSTAITTPVGESLQIDNQSGIYNGRAPNDPNRLSICEEVCIGIFDDEDKAKTRLNAYQEWPNPSDFFKTFGDGSVKLTGDNPITKTEYECNDAVTVNPRAKFNNLLIDKIPLIPNKSVNDAYLTTEAKHVVGSKKIDIPNVNNVRVQTPIHNELTITSPSLNQLEDISLKRAGCKLVTLDDEFTVTLKLDGETWYYTGITTNIKKYVKRVELYCGVCNTTIVSTTSDIQSEYSHTCKADPDKTTDLMWYPITSKVWVENFATGGADRTEEKIYNTPDDYYILTQNKGVLILGKIYDLQVRATNDPTWKLKNAETLSSLPTGERGDNKITTNKFGIKLGYTAYFDLKTLGAASNKINITPKIYYVDTNGNNLTDYVDLYYRTTDQKYRKLADEDIVIKMTVNSTKGEEYNSSFMKDKTESMKALNIDYSKVLNIGGLKKIILTENNSTLAKYKYSGDSRYDYIKSPIKNSRRWYGEVRVPASTIVAEKGATVAEISRGQKIKKTGYLVVVFESIETGANASNNYLKYSIGRDADGVQFSPNGTNLVSPSIMYNEKTNNGAQALKASITLPNGSTFSSYPQTDAPIIVYDVSLRANNDLESIGTH